MALRPRPCVAWRRGFKSSAPRPEAVEDFNAETNAQYFQVGVTVLEAKRVAWSSPHWRHCFVALALDKTRLRTMVRRNMTEPKFKEYFDFDLYKNEQAIQLLTLAVSFFELKCCAPPQILGEINIPLRDIWTQPGHHQQKWYQLISAKQPDLGPVGLISLDISIGNLHEATCCADIVNSSKLISSSNLESQWANYMISVYQAFGLTKLPRGDSKSPSTFVRVSFCNLTGKTDVQKRTFNPVYNEKISIVDIFPSLCTRVTFEVHAEGRFNVLGTSHLELSDISYEGENGFVPTFGPSLLQLYGQSSCKCKKNILQEGGPFYGGALLVALETVVPPNKQANHAKRSIFVEPLGSLALDSVWQMEDFCLFCPLFEVSLLDCKTGCRHSGIAITLEELAGFEDQSSNEFSELKTSIKDLRLHYTGPIAPTPIDEDRHLAVLYFDNAFPVLQLAVTMPDFRFRMYRNNMILALTEELDNTIARAESQLKSESNYVDILQFLNNAFDNVATAILKSIDILGHCKNTIKDVTETTLDQRQCELQKQELQKIYLTVSEYPRIKCFGCGGSKIKKPAVMKMLLMLKDINVTIQKLVFKSPDGWPKIIVWLLEGGSRVAYAKISAADILYSVVPEQCGRKCGTVQTIYLKSLKCGPAVSDRFNECLRVPAKIELMMWLGLHQQTACLASSIPGGYSLKLDKSRMFLETTACVLECRIFIYKANLSGVLPGTFSFVRVYALGLVKETLIRENPNPIWDQTLRIESLMYISLEKLKMYPPEVLIEVLSRNLNKSGKCDDKKISLIGRTTVKSVVDLTSATPVAPQLRNYDIHNIYTEECRGQLSVAAQTVKISENLISTKSRQPYETIPSALIPKIGEAVILSNEPNKTTAGVPCKPYERSSKVPSHETQEASSGTPPNKPREAVTNIPSQSPYAGGTNTVPTSEQREAAISVLSYQREKKSNVPTHQPSTSTQSNQLREVPYNPPRIQSPREPITRVPLHQSREVKIDMPPYQPRKVSTNIPSLRQRKTSTSIPSFQNRSFLTREIPSSIPSALYSCGSHKKLTNSRDVTINVPPYQCEKLSEIPARNTQEASTNVRSCQPYEKSDISTHQGREDSAQACCKPCVPPNGRQETSTDVQSCRPCEDLSINLPLHTRPPGDPCPATTRATFHQEPCVPTYLVHDTTVDAPIYRSRGAIDDVQSLLVYKDSNDTIDTVERLPSYLKPRIKSYKVDIIWWGLREVDYLIKKSCAVLEIDNQVLKSDIINNDTPNCNFCNNRMISRTMLTSFDKAFSASMSFTLYSSSSFGRTVFYGSNKVKNSRKFLVNWVPKNERDISLKSASLIQPYHQIRGIVSDKSNSLRSMQTYSHIPQVVNSYGMKSDISNNSSAVASFNKPCPYSPNSKCKKWYQMFFDKSIYEEEIKLLPANKKGNNRFNERDVKYASVYNAAIEINGRNKEEEHTNHMYLDNITNPTSHDWWSRYFTSEKAAEHGERLDSNIITIYKTELEEQPQFSKFKDWCHSIKLYKSQKTGIPKKDRELVCGILKAGVAIYKWPPPDYTVAVSQCGAELNKSYFEDHPANTPTKFLIRIYVLRALDLMLNGTIGLPDSYVVIGCGKKRLGDRGDYVPKRGNPVFAKMYELNCTLPEDYLLTLYVYNYGQSSTDTLIGLTNIDIENRIYSKHRATVGLPREYKLSGPNKWRDYIKPSTILEEICYKNHIAPPIYPNHSTVIVGETVYRKIDIPAFPTEEQKENICLNLLHQWHGLPICGYPLVPEHVETRKLYKPENPGVEQGKLQMWVDIFPLPLNVKIPASVDITPPSAKEYKLQVTVQALSGLRFKQRGRHPQEAYIYITAWIGNQDHAQVSDVYNSVNASAALPWVILFMFKYQSAEKKIILEEKGVFTEITENKEPILELRVVHCDGAPYTYLGAIAMNLHDMPRASTSPTQNALKAAHSQRGDLFTAGSARGWWPLVDDNLSYAGAIELELNISPKSKKNQNMIRIERMKMSESSDSAYSSQSSVAQEESNNIICSFLNQYTMRIIIIGLLVIASIYYFCSVDCYVFSKAI